LPERRPGARDSMSARRDGPTGSRAKARRRPAGSRQEAAARYCGRIYSLRFRPTELKRRMSATGGRIPSVSKPEPLKEWRLSFKGECGIRRQAAGLPERQRRSSRRAHFPRPAGSRQEGLFGLFGAATPSGNMSYHSRPQKGYGTGAGAGAAARIQSAKTIMQLSQEPGR